MTLEKQVHKDNKVYRMACKHCSSDSEKQKTEVLHRLQRFECNNPKRRISNACHRNVGRLSSRFRYLSMLNVYSGYNHIFIADEDVPKTAFRCPGALGTYEWVVM